MDFPRISAKQYAANGALIICGATAVAFVTCSDISAPGLLVDAAGLVGLGCFCVGTMRLVAKRWALPLAVAMLLSPFLTAYCLHRYYIGAAYAMRKRAWDNPPPDRTDYVNQMERRELPVRPYWMAGGLAVVPLTTTLVSAVRRRSAAPEPSAQHG